MDPFANLEPPAAEEGKQELPPVQEEETAAPAPPPKKRRRVAAKVQPPPQARFENEAEAVPLRDDPAYRLLCAYGKSELIAPKLKKAGVPCEPRALRKVARARLPVILEEAEEALDDSAVDQMSNVALKQGLTCLERLVSSRTRYQITGTTDECFANERWLFLLERAKLKAGIGMTRLDPVTELALITAQTAAIAHARNTSPVVAAPLDLDTPAPSLTVANQ